MDFHGEINKGKEKSTDLIENRHVTQIGKYDNVFCVFEKNQGNILDMVEEHPYYMLRC